MNINMIDSEISVQVGLLKNYISTIELTEHCQFELISNINVNTSELHFPGIYLIEIKNKGDHASFNNWIKDFKSKWEDKEYIDKYVPNTKKIRTSKHSRLDEWIPLYIGKSKNIGNRIHEHLHKKLEQKTYALKLLSRTNMNDNIFRVRIFKGEFKNYDTIMPIIESELRNKYNPILGRQ